MEYYYLLHVVLYIKYIYDIYKLNSLFQDAYFPRSTNKQICGRFWMMIKMELEKSLAICYVKRSSSLQSEGLRP